MSWRLASYELGVLGFLGATSFKLRSKMAAFSSGFQVGQSVVSRP